MKLQTFAKWRPRRRGHPRPGEVLLGPPDGTARIEIERVLGRNGAGWKVLDSRARLVLIAPTRTAGVWQPVPGSPI